MSPIHVECLRIIFLSAGAGTGVVRVDHKKPSAGAVRVRVKNDGSFCSLVFRVVTK